MKRTASGLWLAPNFNMLRFRKRERTVTLPNGERAKVTYDESGTVRHTEHGDQVDAVVRPATIRMILRPASVGASRGGFANPSPIKSSFTPKGPS